jgi:guanosine-3',5'-bis(diphosphate) 3'-pyrophosphohydrolase
MKEFSNYWKALTFAGKNHGMKLRKDNETPYIVHPLRITSILRAVGLSEFKEEDLMIAALFHDLVEDTETNLEEIKSQFSEKIASIVKELTKPKNGNKEKWLKSFDTVSKEAKIIKMADRIDNLMDMNIDIWSIEKVKSYAEQGKIVLDKCGNAHSELAIKLKNVIENVFNTL